MKFKVSRQGDASVVHLEGDIDEDIKEVMAAVATAVTTKKVVFDVGGVRKINSIGVKHWILALDAVSTKLEISFVQCPSAFVDMAVMVPAFTRGAPIRSFLATFGCQDCGREKNLLVEIKDSAGVLPTDLTCERCGNKMAADEELDGDLEYVLSCA